MKISRKKSYIIEFMIAALLNIAVIMTGWEGFLKIIVTGTIILSAVMCAFLSKYIDIDILRENKKKVLSLAILLLIIIFFVYAHYISKLAMPGSPQFILMIAALIFIAITTVCSILIYLSSKDRIDIAVTMIVSCFGLVYMFAMPVSVAPDEIVHAFTAYHTSNMMMGIDDSACKETGQVLIRTDDAQYNMQALQYTDEQVISVLSQLTNPLRDETLIQAGWGVMYGNEYLFVPCAVGLTVGRLLHLGTVATLMLGRAFNFVFYLILLFFSLKILPFGKQILGMIALLPMSIQQCMSYSYDCIVNACAFFLVAMTMKIWLEGKKTEKHRYVRDLVVLLASILLFKAKGHAYAPIAILPYVALLWNKWKCPENKKRNLVLGASLGVLFAVIIGVAILIVFGNDHLVPYVEHKLSYLDANGYTVSFLINNPTHIVNLFVNTLIHMTPYYVASCIGRSLGWLEITVNKVYIIVYLVLLIAVFFIKKEKNIVGSASVLTIVLCTISVLFIFVGMAVSWTPIGVYIVQGVQGRYFLPMLLPLCLSFKGWIHKNYSQYLLIMTMYLSVLTTFDMMAWFFR